MHLRDGQNAGQGAWSWQDIAALSQDRGLRLVAPDLQPQDPAVRGLFVRRTLRSGLSLHISDAVDLHDLTTRVVARPGTTLTVFLHGRAAVSLGSRAYQLGAGCDGGGRPSARAALYSLADADQFERRGIRGQHLRKVALSLPPGWLSTAGLSGGAARLAARLDADHAALTTLPVPAEVVQVAVCMLAEAAAAAVAPTAGPCGDLMQESRALELLARVLEAASGATGSAGARPSHAEARLRAARDFLAAHLDQDVTLAETASAACVSVSTLQRLFRDHLGMPVYEYLRRLRLAEARRFLERGEGPVTEAALRAGYTSPANFATAFKREFGMPPSRCRG